MVGQRQVEPEHKIVRLPLDQLVADLQRLGVALPGARRVDGAVQIRHPAVRDREIAQEDGVVRLQLDQLPADLQNLL